MEELCSDELATISSRGSKNQVLGVRSSVLGIGLVTTTVRAESRYAFFGGIWVRTSAP
jgi:hypothetical protein